MIEHIPYRPEHAKEIIAHGAIGIGEVTAEQIELCSNVKLNGVAFTTICDGRVVACAGIEAYESSASNSCKDIGQAWVLCVNDIGKIHMNPQDNRAKFFEIAKPFRRVHAPMKPDFLPGLKFAEYMGFHYESTLKKCNPDGSDALIYVLGDI
jgi:hypothetical protein